MSWSMSASRCRASIPKSGFKLHHEYRDHDAERLFEVDHIQTQEASQCISGQILKGLKKPHDCPAFGTQCTPQSPLGATMVSSEDPCAAYYLYGRHLEERRVGRGAAQSRTGGRTLMITSTAPPRELTGARESCAA